MFTVRRRAVFALMFLSLLCDCCCSARATSSGISEDVNVTVELTCAENGKDIRWRFPGENNWMMCSSSTEDAAGSVGEDDLLTKSLCYWADDISKKDCKSHCTSSSGDAVSVCTANYSLDPKSKLYERWNNAKATPGSSSASPGGKSAVDTEPGTNPAGNAAHAPGNTDAPSTSQDPPKAPSSAPPATGFDGTSTTTTTTTKSPGVAKHTKSNADSSEASNTPFVHTSLLLLLLTALACAAGQC
ncbi:mucin-like glycoprotein [Trypanosoma rangeli]|uniref:Mucin-like glycoprotein n=1 Tax=Trypanosoma rangeli TaxID=5698 RepID=A0A422NA73_TRYRA|nr:mucin-like glycoprotein [Trypanosoma rangeli]RNF02365.1 mucin-like glycoprotein [Trypanosoma rangeli]|eukprot:RNF02365.1 mucin-like glycoprotein [Trypanosoma rangeli]